MLMKTIESTWAPAVARIKAAVPASCQVVTKRFDYDNGYSVGVRAGQRSWFLKLEYHVGVDPLPPTVIDGDETVANYRAYAHIRVTDAGVSEFINQILEKLK